MQIVLLIHNTTQCMETLHKQPLSRSSQNNLSLHTTLHTLTNKSLQFFSWSKIPRISGKPHVHYRIHNRCYKLHPSHHSSSEHPNNIRWPVQTTQLLTVQPSPSARHFHPVSLNASLRTVLSLSLTDGQALVLHCDVSGRCTATHNCIALTHFAILFQLPTYRNVPLRIPTSTPVLWTTQKRHCRISSKVGISTLRRNAITTAASCIAMHKTVNCIRQKDT